MTPPLSNAMGSYGPFDDDEVAVSARQHVACLPRERRAQLEAEWSSEWLNPRQHAAQHLRNMDPVRRAELEADWERVA